MNLINKLFGNIKIYKIILWVKKGYQSEQQKTYRDEQFCSIGENVVIDKNVSINMPERVILKDRALIHSGAIINSTGGLCVGVNSGIGYNNIIFTAQHQHRDAETIPFNNIGELKPVIIEDYVTMGFGVMVLPGVRIGEGAIIGMGSVVTKNVPPLAIVLGNPAEVLMYRDKKHYDKCKDENKFQSQAIDNYEYIISPFIKRRFLKELKELGIL